MRTDAAPTSAPVSLDVVLLWQGDRIAGRHLASDGSVTLGDGSDTLAPIPCATPASQPDAFEIARLAAGTGRARVPAGAIGALRRGEGAFEIAFGPAEVRLQRGDSIDIPIGEFRCMITANEPERLPAGPVRAPGAWLHVAVAAAAHALVLGLAAQSAMASNRDEGDEQADALRKLMVSAELRARAPQPTDDDASGAGRGREVNRKDGDGRAAGGTRAAGEEGALGDHKSHERGARYAIEDAGDKAHEVTLSRAGALADAARFGMIGLVGQASESPIDWGREAELLGRDPMSASGAMWGDKPGYTYGESGLGLSGIGEGGGGFGEGIGLGAIGTIGHGDGPPGPGTGGAGAQPRSMGSWSGVSWSSSSSVGRIGGSHRTRGGWCRCGFTSVSGRLPPEAVQRVVRANFGRFRACYEDGLRRNPTLAGGVTTRFVIGRDGAVSSADSGGATMSDPAVVSCVTRAFYGLSFPQPEGGVVTVSYPILFSPG